MANHWIEHMPDLTSHEFEIYDNCSSTTNMDQFHGHSFYELRFIKNGSITHYTENSTCNLGSGDISIIPPGMFHRTTPVMPLRIVPDYARVLLYVSTNFMHTMDTDSFKLSEVFDTFGYSGPQHMHLEPAELNTFYRPLQEIVRINHDDDPLQHLQNRAQVMLLLSRAAERIVKIGVPAKPQEEKALVPRVIAYINANLSANLSLDSLSDLFFVSKFYLSHQFKQYTQLSLHQYVLTRRMMHAQILLRSGQSPTAVSAACGYHEYSSFYKAFLRETGQSPRAFM